MDKSTENIGWKWIVLIFTCAIIYRILCYFSIRDIPLFTHPIVDAGYFYNWAQRIVAGDFWGHGPDDVFKPPVYAYFLATIMAITGKNIWVILWIQYIIGALSCIFTAFLAARLFDKKTGIIIGMLSAFYGPYVFFESQLLTPVLTIFLSLAALLVILRPDGRITLGRISFSGLLFGISAGVRADILLPASGMLIYLLWFHRSPILKVNLTRFVVLGMALVAPLAPIAVRNYSLTGELIPVSSNAGINFYTGNAGKADGISAVPVGLKWERLVSRVPQHILEHPGAASKWWTAAAFDEIISKPKAFLRLTVKKMMAFFNGREFRNNICYHFIQNRVWPLRLPFLQFSVIVPLAFCGLFFLWNNKAKLNFGHRAIFILITGYWVVGILFFVSARFRLPAVPFIIIISGFAISQFLEKIRYRHRERLLWGFPIFLLSGIIVWIPWLRISDNGWVRDYVNLGNAYKMSGNGAAAKSSYLKALEIKNDPDAHYLLSRYLLKEGDIFEAQRRLQKALTAIPNSPDLLLAAARAFQVVRNVEKAKEFLYQLIELSEKSNLWPKRAEWATAHLMLAAIEPHKADEHWKEAWAIHARTAAELSFIQRKSLNRVLTVFRKEAEEEPWNWYSQANYGMALMETHNHGLAVKFLGKASKINPEKTGLRFQLARALIKAGTPQQALPILKEILNQVPEGAMRRKAEHLLNIHKSPDTSDNE